MARRSLQRLILGLVVVLACSTPTGAVSIRISDDVALSGAVGDPAPTMAMVGSGDPQDAPAAAQAEFATLILLGSGLFLVARYRRARARRHV